MDDPVTYAKVERFVNDTRYVATTLTDSNGNRVVLRRAVLETGYLTADGSVLAPCADGRGRIFDSATETLRCPEPEAGPPATEAMSAWQPVVIGFAVVAVLLVVPACRYGAQWRAKCTSFPAQTSVVAFQTTNSKFDATGLCLFPPRLQFPATVTFEYQLLPGQSV